MHGGRATPDQVLMAALDVRNIRANAGMAVWMVVIVRIHLRAAGVQAVAPLIQVTDHRLNISLRPSNVRPHLTPPTVEDGDPGDGWDGTLGGEVVQAGLYAWKLETRDLLLGVGQVYFGHVSLLR